MYRAGQGMPTLPEHLIQILFCKDFREFQAFVLFVLSFSLFQICPVFLDYAPFTSHMVILHSASYSRYVKDAY